MSFKQLRIGLVGPLPPESGGMANQTFQLAGLLRGEGAVVEMIQVNAPYSPSWAGNLRGIRALFRLVPYIAHLFRSSRKVDVYHVMANSGWSWHLYAAPAIWVARITGKPVVVNYRGGEADTFLQKSMFWVRPSLARADSVIVPSGFLQAVFLKYGFATSIVPNIINLSRFSPDTSTSSGDTEAGPCILVARNLEPIYDNATALRAISMVKRTFPSVQLLIGGSGPERQALEKLTEELGITDSVVFTGKVDNVNMAALYRQADVMINPSLVDNMPNSVLEALASGVPVVSTNVGGVPYIVDHDRTALLVPPQDPEAMAAAVLALLSDPAKAQRMREAGIEAVQRFTWARVQGRLLEAYEKVLIKKNQGALEQT
jgi:glycosyltransferase involved in cell wall biosynthesis